MTVAEQFDRHYGAVHAFLSGLSGSPTVADDLAQETYLRLLKLRVPDGRATEKYALRVAYTCWTRYLKNRKPTISLEDIPTPATDTCPQQVLEKAEEVAALQRCLARMSPEHRAIVFLVWGRDYTFVEASEILGVPRRTLVSRHRRALQWLRTNLGPMME